MKQVRQVTAIIEREGKGYVALCPELMLQPGRYIESARNNLQEAVELFLKQQTGGSRTTRTFGTFCNQVEVEVGRLRVLSGRDVCGILAGEGFA